MPDYSNPPSVTLVFGTGGSGKTSFAFRLLLNAPGVACRFIFDDRGQAAERLKLRPARTARELEAALVTRWVCFQPHLMFPNAAQLPAAFDFFCAWAFKASQRGPGRKIFFVDELWQWVDARTIPDPLQNIIRTGRFHGLEFVSATHSPREYHRDLRRMVTEWVCFNTVEPADLDAVRPYFPGVDQVAQLTRGKFVSYLRETNTVTPGAVF